MKESSTMSTRISELITYYNLTISSFSREIGLNSPATIQKIINYNRNGSPKTTGKILSRFPDVNYQWLVTGRGQMIKSENVNQKNNNEDLTITSSQIINYIEKSVNNFIETAAVKNKELLVNVLQKTGEGLHKQAMQMLDERILNLSDRVNSYMENKFENIDNQISQARGVAQVVNKGSTKSHSNTIEKISELDIKLDLISENVDRLNVLVNEIEVKEGINANRIKEFINPKKS